MGNVRAVAILATLALATPPAMLLQAILLAVGAPASRRFPVVFHRFVCRVLGVRIAVHGRLSDERPLLVAANHASWLDIPVLGALAPMSFIAKREVGTWPLIGWLARLQRSIFVDRDRRSRTGDVNREIAARLSAGDTMVLFAEGTSGDGNRVLPFRTALLGAVHQMAPKEDGAPPHLMVQPLAVAYVRLNGLPMGRQHRPVVAWHGSVSLGPHLWRFLKAGQVDVEIAVGAPIALDRAAERKAVAAAAERQVRAMVQTRLTGRTPPAPAREKAEDRERESPLFPTGETG